MIISNIFSFTSNALQIIIALQICILSVLVYRRISPRPIRSRHREEVPVQPADIKSLQALVSSQQRMLNRLITQGSPLMSPCYASGFFNFSTIPNPQVPKNRSYLQHILKKHHQSTTHWEVPPAGDHINCSHPAYRYNPDLERAMARVWDKFFRTNAPCAESTPRFKTLVEAIVAQRPGPYRSAHYDAGVNNEGLLNYDPYTSYRNETTSSRSRDVACPDLSDSSLTVLPKLHRNLHQEMFRQFTAFLCEQHFAFSQRHPYKKQALKEVTHRNKCRREIFAEMTAILNAHVARYGASHIPSSTMSKYITQKIVQKLTDGLQRGTADANLATRLPQFLEYTQGLQRSLASAPLEHPEASRDLTRALDSLSSDSCFEIWGHPDVPPFLSASHYPWARGVNYYQGFNRLHLCECQLLVLKAQIPRTWDAYILGCVSQVFLRRTQGHYEPGVIGLIRKFFGTRGGPLQWHTRRSPTA